MHSPLLHRLLIVLLLGIAWGCDSPSGPAYVPLTEDEARLFSDSLVETIEQYDASFIFEHEDKGRTVERLDHWIAGDTFKIDDTEEAKTFLAQMPFTSFLLESGGRTGQKWVYAFPNRIRTTPDSNYVVQIRVHDLEFEVNYFEFLVEKRQAEAANGIVLTDLYSHNMGMWISELVYQQYICNQYFESITPPTDSLTLLDSLYFFVEQMNFPAADSMYHTIPPEGRSLLIPNKIHLDIAGNVTEQHYEAALQTAQELFPRDPDVLRRQIQWSYFSATYDTFHALIDTLEAHLGGPDAYTLWSHGDAYQLAGQPDRAATYFSQAMDLEPDFLLPSISMFYNHLDRRDYSSGIDMLDHLDRRFGVKLEMLEMDRYPGFLNSKEMQQWTERSDPMP